MALSYGRVASGFLVSLSLVAWLTDHICRFFASFYAAQNVLAGQRHDGLFGGMENTESPSVITVRFHPKWLQELAVCVVQAWLTIRLKTFGPYLL